LCGDGKLLHVKKLIALIFAAGLLAGCTPGNSTDGDTADPTEPAKPDKVSCDYRETGNAAKDVELPNGVDVNAKGTAVMTLELNDLPIQLTLDREQAPCTVNSFESLAQQGYFDGTKCHRLVDSGIYVLQCGDPTATGTGGPGYQFDDETDGLTEQSYTAGTVAMANAGPATNGSQFFFVFEDSPLSPAYTVFAHIDEAGLKIIQDIALGGTDGANGDGAPILPATITSVTGG
jgi:peptidyl-prolyl cis-trans isomerase B (cyclophilin B)